MEMLPAAQPNSQFSPDHIGRSLLLCARGHTCDSRVTMWWKVCSETTSGPSTLRIFPSTNKNDPKDDLYKQVIAIIIGGPPTGSYS